MTEKEMSQLRRDWDVLGERDPFWAVLSIPDRKGGRWSADEFFGDGSREIAGVLTRVDELADDLERGRALDFGCGPGRLTQALSDHFSEVDGVDIAPSMVSLAERLNRHGDRCRYQVLNAQTLPFEDGTFDFVYTTQTLQHIPQRLTFAYIDEFLRVLKADGMLVFQLPSRAAHPVRGWLRRMAPGPLLRWRFRRIYGTEAFMDIRPIGLGRMLRFLSNRSVVVLAADPNLDSGANWPAIRYYCRHGREGANTTAGGAVPRPTTS